MDQSCLAVPFLSSMYCFRSASSTSPLVPMAWQLSLNSTGRPRMVWYWAPEMPPSGIQISLSPSMSWGSWSSRSGCIIHTMFRRPEVSARVHIFKMFWAVSVPAACPASASAVMRAPLFKMPVGFPLPSPEMMASSSRRLAATVKADPKNPVMKAAS